MKRRITYAVILTVVIILFVTVALALEVYECGKTTDKDTSTLLGADWLSSGQAQASYDQWMNEPEWFVAKTENEEPNIASQTTIPLTEGDIRTMADSILSEIFSLNRTERASTQIIIEYDETYHAWVIHYSVPSTSLRDVHNDGWIIDSYDSKSDQYRWSVMLSEDGTMLDARSPDELAWNQLIPRSAYPHWDDWQDDLRAFMFCTTEERASFSAVYKPIVDAFLLEHPYVQCYFEQARSGQADLYNQTIYDITRQTYGIPGEYSLSEGEAVSIAIGAYLSSGLDGVTDEMIRNRCLICSFYIVTDPETPIWKVSIFSSQLSGNWQADDHRNGYRVVIDGATGTILEEGELFGTHDEYTVSEDALWRY